MRVRVSGGFLWERCEPGVRGLPAGLLAVCGRSELRPVWEHGHRRALPAGRPLRQRMRRVSRVSPTLFLTPVHRVLFQQQLIFRISSQNLD